MVVEPARPGNVRHGVVQDAGDFVGRHAGPERPGPRVDRGIAQRLHRQMQHDLEAAIARLDEIDGDPDLEDSCEDEGVDTDSEPDDCVGSVAIVRHYDCSPIRLVRQS